MVREEGIVGVLAASEGRLSTFEIPPKARTELNMHWEDSLRRKADTKSHVMKDVRAPRV